MSEESKSSPVISQRHRSGSVNTKQSKESLSRRQSERHQMMRIQNYVVYRKTIGAGSMGKVKLAECLTDKEKIKYAVKIMPKIDLESEPKQKSGKDPKDTPKEREQRTVREMAIMRLLRHPNICQLKEYIAEGDKYYMFLEYVDGGQLLDYIVKNGKLREKQARKFARQIASALDYCHRNSIVHRDLKIENILITQTEQVKIIDFGLSNIYSPTQQLNTFCGSLYFAAPELLKAKQYTGPEVDVWSFGVVLYVLVCGRVPFDDVNLPALHEKIKSGVVEEYPDHLGKECLDLLSKIFVVDPASRITLAGIQAHPWMNKGFEERIRNYLPHRQPIEKIDPDIVQGMDGFGLGSQEEISEKLQKIISSSAYQAAANKIDQNFQKKQNEDQTISSRPKWRRTLSTSRSKKYSLQDDFNSLPAMYDPLVSIYYLVKERKESDQRKAELLNSPLPTPLSRSTSTVITRPKQNDDLAPSSSAKTDRTLTRRRTFDTSKKLPALPKQTEQPKLASQFPLPPPPPTPQEQKQPPTPTPSKSERLVSAGGLIRKKSMQAVRRLTSKLPNKQGAPEKAEKTEKKLSNRTSSSSNNTTSPVSSLSVGDNPSRKSLSKSHWLKLEVNNKSDVLKKVPSHHEKKLPEPTPSKSITRLSSKAGSTARRSWKRLSMNRKSTRLSFDNSTGNLPISDDPMGADIKALSPSKSDVTNRLLTEKPKVGTQPKSLFNFNRGNLFRVTPSQMMTDLELVLSKMNIQQEKSSLDLFSILCTCEYRHWILYADTEVILPKEAINFTVMVYEARWAGGRLGVKLKEADDDTGGLKDVYGSLYHSILNELGKLSHLNIV